jgi:hypothetical protein
VLSYHPGVAFPANRQLALRKIDTRPDGRVGFFHSTH